MRVKRRNKYQAVMRVSSLYQMPYLRLVLQIHADEDQFKN